MTIQELIKEYKLKIIAASNKTAQTKIILSEIDKLSYENGIKITERDKLHILQELRREVLLESRHVFSQDNREYLDLIDGVIKALGGK